MQRPPADEPKYDDGQEQHDVDGTIVGRRRRRRSLEGCELIQEVLSAYDDTDRAGGGRAAGIRRRPPTTGGGLEIGTGSGSPIEGTPGYPLLLPAGRGFGRGHRDGDAGAAQLVVDEPDGGGGADRDSQLAMMLKHLDATLYCCFS